MNVFTHELGHTLGIGLNYGAAVVYGKNLGGASPYFSGPTARAGFDRVGGTRYTGNAVPLEAINQSSRDQHWADNIQLTELMSTSGGGALSRISAGCLEDLGYQVNLAETDSFVLVEPGTVGAVTLD